MYFYADKTAADVLLKVEISVQEESLTLTGNPELGMSSPLGILQVSSFSRTWALQLTPPMVIAICMHVLTVFRLLCCGGEGQR